MASVRLQSAIMQLKVLELQLKQMFLLIQDGRNRRCGRLDAREPNEWKLQNAPPSPPKPHSYSTSIERIVNF